MSRNREKITHWVVEVYRDGVWWLLPHDYYTAKAKADARIKDRAKVCPNDRLRLREIVAVENPYLPCDDPSCACGGRGRRFNLLSHLRPEVAREVLRVCDAAGTWDADADVLEAAGYLLVAARNNNAATDADKRGGL